MNRTDFIVALVLIAFGAFVVEESLRMPRFENIGGTVATAPGLVPGLLGAIILLFGVVMAIRAVVARPHATVPGGTARETAAAETAGTRETSSSEAPSPVAGSQLDEEPSEPLEPARAGWIRLAWILALSLTYATILIGRVPFWFATFLFVFSSILVFERSGLRNARAAVFRVAIAAAIGGAVAWAVPFVFENIFLVNLP